MARIPRRRSSFSCRTPTSRPSTLHDSRYDSTRLHRFGQRGDDRRRGLRPVPAVHPPGQAPAEVRPKKRTVVATVQIGAFGGTDPGPSPDDVVKVGRPADIEEDQEREVLGREAAGGGGVDLAGAERIVTAGRGVGGPDEVSVAAELAAALDAELGASRPVVDNGWLPASTRSARAATSSPEPLRRPRRVRLDPAPDGHERLPHHRRHQQGPRSPHLQRRPLRHRRRSPQGCAGVDAPAEGSALGLSTRPTG